MKILQQPLSETQKSAMFYHGVIATSGMHSLETFQDGEIGYEYHWLIGADTPKLAQYDVHDVDLDAEVIVDIYVDKFFVIKYNHVIIDDIVFNNYDEAMKAFTKIVT